MRLRMGTTKVQFLQQFLHVSGDFPALQHELASRRPVGRGKTIHAAIEDGRLKGELVDPVCNQGTLPIAVGAREFKCNLAPLVANSLGDWFSAREVVEELLLMVIDQYFRRFVSPGNVEWLKLAATSAAKGEPNQDAVFETTTLDEEHDCVQRVRVNDVIAKSDTNHQATWTVVCHLAEGRRLATAYLYQERREEV